MDDEDIAVIIFIIYLLYQVVSSILRLVYSKDKKKIDIISGFDLGINIIFVIYFFLFSNGYFNSEEE